MGLDMVELAVWEIPRYWGGLHPLGWLRRLWLMNLWKAPFLAERGPQNIRWAFKTALTLFPSAGCIHHTETVATCRVLAAT